MEIINESKMKNKMNWIVLKYKRPGIRILWMNFWSQPVIWIWVSEWTGVVYGMEKKKGGEMRKRRMWEMLGEWQNPGTVKEECQG